MGFMRPEWYETDFWLVETSMGTDLVPQDVEGDPTKLQPYVEGTIESSEDVYAQHGWIGRMSAPGYMDCTDWLYAETEEEIKALLAEAYDLCPKHMCDLDDGECPECRAESEEDES